MGRSLPIAGTWLANLSKSQRDSNHQFQSLTINFELRDQVVVLTFEGIDPAGKKVSGTSEFYLDDKEHPISESTGLVQVARLVGPNKLETEFKQNGVVISRGSYTLTLDGNMLTSVGEGVDPNGSKYQQIIVFDRSEKS